jgi:hypothetical protein
METVELVIKHIIAYTMQLWYYLAAASVDW